MRRNTAVCIFWCLAVLVLISCRKRTYDQVLEYANTEAELKKEMINRIVRSFDIETTEVFVLPQIRAGHSEVSKDIRKESYQGAGFSPEGPPGSEGQVPPAYQDLTNLAGDYSSSKITVNYAVDTKKSIHYDYLTFLIVIDAKYADKRESLEENLQNFILNQYRGDVLTVVVKE